MIAEYEAIIAKDESAKTDIKVTREDVLEKISCLKAQMMNPKNAEHTKLLLQEYIERIVVDNNSVKVTFKVTFSFCYGEGVIEVCYNHTAVKSRRTLKK